MVDGAPVAVTGRLDAMARIWDLRTGRPLGQPLAGHTGYVRAMACTTLDGAGAVGSDGNTMPVAVTGSEDGTVRIWDLRAGRPFGQPLTGHTGDVSSVACTTLDGAPVAVTGSEDSTVRIWDLRTGQPLGQPLTGHTGVRAVACTTVGGAPVAVTGGLDSMVRIWDLRVRTATAVLAVSSPRTAAFTPAGDLMVGFHRDIALFRRQSHGYATQI
ncbi:hypothetical protein OG535_02740 [Kitasatospora sp. NBC_00085]|uniref:hypothetical protein n=1 Tax=unclassified Kitasatospora TaxID=2633591 RepID=UPI003250A8B0